MARRNILVHPGFLWIKRTNRQPWTSTRKTKIKVLLAHGQHLFRERLSKLLEREPDMEVVAEAANGLEAAQACQLLAPDVLVMDIALASGGLKALRALLRRPSAQRGPTLSDSPRILLLGFPLSREAVLEAIREGVPGILGECDGAELGRAIRALYNRQGFFSAAIAGLVAREKGTLHRCEAFSTSLTAQEQEILYLIAQGMRDRQIAEALSVSLKTVRNRLRQLFRKLNLKNRTQAALFALKAGVV